MEKKGWGEKRGHGLDFFYKNRWFHITSDRSLNYYTREDDGLKGTVPLQGATVVEHKAGTHGLTVRTARGRHYNIRFKSEPEKDEWRDAINRAIRGEAAPVAPTPTTTTTTTTTAPPTTTTTTTTPTPAPAPTQARINIHLPAPTATTETRITITAPPAPQPKPEPPKVTGPAAIEEFFLNYKDADSDDMIGPENVARLIGDLGVELDDIVVLILAWQLDAADQGYFSRKEFVEGMTKLRCSSPSQLKAKLAEIKGTLRNEATLKELYEFAFEYCKETEETKVIDVEMASGMLDILLKDRPHTAKFAEFLRQQSGTKVLNKDQWNCFLSFGKEVKQDLSNYDENASWPALMDEYVEWLRENQN